MAVSATEIWLTRIEGRLRTALVQGDMPFLGLYSDLFDDNARIYLRDKALDPARAVQAFISGLRKWPATFATYLTVHIVEGYGEAGNAEVYPFIAEALGTKPNNLNHTVRHKLCRAYREACLKLGLSVLPAGRSLRPLVDEYLRQAGVPMRYLDSLIWKFEIQGRHLGLPDQDDPEALHLWQDQLLPKLGPPLSRTIPRAIENDETAYYTGLYLRILNYSDIDECHNEVERQAFTALESETTSRSRKHAAIPELHWRDGDVGVFLPAGSGTVWTVRVITDHSPIPCTTRIEAGQEPQFIALSDKFPLKVELESPDSNFTFPVWEDRADNRVLVFGRSGRLVSGARLGGEQLDLPPGSYTLVTRWQPQEPTLEPTEVNTNPTIFESPLSLVAGQRLELLRGPAKLEITGKSIASMEWSGQRQLGMSGRELLVGHLLSIRVSVPDDIRAAASEGFDIIVKCRGCEVAVTIPALLQDSASMRLDLGDSLRSFPLGVNHYTVSLRRTDIPNRPLTNISGLIWNGLEHCNGIRFSCVSPDAFSSSNINRQDCENIRFEPDGITYRDAEQRYFRSAFTLADNQVVAFRWLVPGIFLSLEDLQGEEVSERPIAKGATVQVRPSNRMALKVFSTYEGLLRLGDYQKLIGIASMAGTRIYLSPLLEHLTATDQTLKFIGRETGIEFNLLTIVAPHQAVRFQSHRSGEHYTLHFEVEGSVDEVAIEAIEILSGRRESISLPVNRLDAATGLPMQKVWALSAVLSGGGNKVEVCWKVPDWSDGAYVFRIRNHISQRWGELVNARGDVFIGSLLVGSLLGISMDAMDSMSTEERLDVFGRLTEHLLECYAEESWQDAKWLARAWEDIAGTLEFNTIQQLTRVVTLALKRTPSSVAESWVPIHVIAARLPQAFAHPAVVYSRLPRGELLGLKLLLSMPEYGTKDLDLFSRTDSVSPFLSFAFENSRLLGVGQDVMLSNFSLARFRQMADFVGEDSWRRVRRSEDWLPSPGQFLGFLHYWWAIHRLESGLAVTVTGNDFRRGQALRLAGRLSNAGLFAVLPEANRNHFGALLSLGLSEPFKLEDDDDQHRENLRHLVDLISVIACAARITSRSNNVLDAFQDRLSSLGDLPIEKLRLVLGYVLYLGMDLFLYYLGLWEFALIRDMDKSENNE